MKKIDKLTVKYHGDTVGIISLTPDNKLLAFEYATQWIAEGFSISPLELPLKKGIFIAKSTPFYGDFGIFEDSLPEGYGRYLLHKALLREGIDDRNLSAIDRLSIVGKNGMGALTYEPETIIKREYEMIKSSFIRAFLLCDISYKEEKNKERKKWCHYVCCFYAILTSNLILSLVTCQTHQLFLYIIYSLFLEGL